MISTKNFLLICLWSTRNEYGKWACRWTGGRGKQLRTREDPIELGNKESKDKSKTLENRASKNKKNIRRDK